MDLDRRNFIGASTAAAAGMIAPSLARAAPASLLDPLSAFIRPYMTAMNAPGMIVGLADAGGWSETAAYGFADTAAGRPIGSLERFHIGSITKSFAAIMILQLAEEGKLRLDADITRYLPKLRLNTPFAPITVHHLLCHSSGVPSEGPTPGWPDQVAEQVFMPGSKFHYCNTGYEWLGRIIEAVGGESWTRALQRRLLVPLGMDQTFATIGPGMRAAEVPSYFPREDDRPFARNGPLTRATPLVTTSAAGCIASTAHDMNLYIQMLARGGKGRGKRILSPDSLALMVRKHIAADEFGPGAGYGYGWMITKVDGKPVIRHTGGMVSFMSSIHVDLDAGFGAFASVNAQQGYRPVPVTAYAVSLYRAQAAKAALPPAPDPNPDKSLKLSDYEGRFGDVAVKAAGKGLSVDLGRKTLTLQSIGEDKFVCLDPRFRLFAFQFVREKAHEPAGDTPPPVAGLVWGRESWTKAGGKLPEVPEANRMMLSPDQLASYEGYYAMGNAWVNATRIVARDGRLWIDGLLPLAAIGPDRFRFADEPANPETVLFTAADTFPRVVAIGGAALTRIGDPFMETA